MPVPFGILTKAQLRLRNVQTVIQNGITALRIPGLSLLSHGIALWSLRANATVNI